MKFDTIIVGAGGFLGHRLCLAATSPGSGSAPELIAGVSRRRPIRQTGGVTPITGDRRRPDLAARLLQSGARVWIDTAINDADDATELLRACRQATDSGFRLPLFVVTSTVGEHARIMHEGGTIRADSPLHADDAHARGKLDAFQILADQTLIDLAWVILPMMWGPGDHEPDGQQGRTREVIRAIIANKPVPLCGGGRNAMPDGYVDTIAKAIIHISTTFSGSGIRRIPIAGPEPMTPAQFVAEAGGELGIDPIIARDDGQGSSQGRSPFPGSSVTMDCTDLYMSGFAAPYDWRAGVRLTAQAELVESGRAWGCQR